jgi:hypothetical protein
MSKHNSDTTADLFKLRPRAEWHEDYGDVLWHHLNQYQQVCEAPIVARDTDDDLEDKMPWAGYYTHWSPLPNVKGPGDV